MAQITLKGSPINTIGELPPVGSTAPEFNLTTGDLGPASLADFAGKKVVLNIVGSLDTSTCALSAKRFNKEVTQLENTVVLNISADLPFAQGRFCESEGLTAVINLSTFRSPEFGTDYGVTVIDSPIAGLLGRSIVVVDENGKVIYTEQVAEFTDEPNYEAALEALKG